MLTVLHSPLFDQVTDPTEFYDLLPTDGRQIDLPHLAGNSWGTLFNALFDTTFDTIAQSQLDELAVFLLQTIDPDIPRRQLRALADHFSMLYVQALHERTENVRKKMSVQRLNFFLRSILDARVPPVPRAREAKLFRRCPWDWAIQEKTTIYVVSRRPNLVVQQDGEERHLQLGLPTQVDVIDEGQFSIGSFYSNGGYRFSNGGVEFVPHNAPIVLQFRFDGRQWFLDSQGRLFDGSTGTILSAAPTSHVTRARRFGRLLYVMDWTVASVIHTFDLVQQSWRTRTIPGVFLPNDLLRLDDDLYVVDKQQGHIFKFDPEFRPVSRQCGFGRGPGRLFDPIAIHAAPDGTRLQVMNWVPGSIVTVPRF
jgi:hypothetical protein